MDRAEAQGVELIEVVNPALAKYQGMTFAEIGRAMGKDARDAAMDVAVADHGASQVVIDIMGISNVRAAVSSPIITFGADSPERGEGWAAEPYQSASSRVRHIPAGARQIRAPGARHAARRGDPQDDVTRGEPGGMIDSGVLRPGDGRRHRGLRPGNHSGRQATFTDPLKYSTGVKDVIVNGRFVVLDNKITDERPGRILRGPGYHPAAQ